MTDPGNVGVSLLGAAFILDKVLPYIMKLKPGNTTNGNGSVICRFNDPATVDLRNRQIADHIASQLAPKFTEMLDVLKDIRDAAIRSSVREERRQ